jgi:hypothetical protein
MCETRIGKCKADFYEYSNFYISGEYLREFGPLRKNSWLQNMHHNTNFYESICNCSYSYLTFHYLRCCLTILCNILLLSIYFHNVWKIK